MRYGYRERETEAVPYSVPYRPCRIRIVVRLPKFTKRVNVTYTTLVAEHLREFVEELRDEVVGDDVALKAKVP